MKKIRILILAMAAGLMVYAAPVQAVGVWDACSGGGSESAVCADTSNAYDLTKTIINVFLSVIGMLAVIMIIHSGFKYINSRGDAEGVKNAKNTLLYSVVGLIVAISAFGIVNFVLEEFK